MDMKMCLLQPLQVTLDAIYKEGNELIAAAGLSQRMAQPPGTNAVAEVVIGTDLHEQPHLVMSRGANQKHIYQGNILCCSAQHPLLARAIGECLQTTRRQLQKQYLRFCEFLWEEMQRDLGSMPAVGWNFCPTLGPIYLFEEKLLREKGKIVQAATTSTNEAVPVDGYFMCIANSATCYAATRAWGWNHGFLEVALTSLAVTKQEAVEQSMAQSTRQSMAQPLSEAASSSGGRTGAGTEAVAPATTEAASELTAAILAECVSIANESYSDLVPTEVATLVGLGLRPAQTKTGYLTCIHCRNRRRGEKKFQGVDQVREHFQNHDGADPAAVTSVSVAEEPVPEMESMEPAGRVKMKV